MACIHEGLSGNPVQAIKPFFALATPVVCASLAMNLGQQSRLQPTRLSL